MQLVLLCRDKDFKEFGRAKVFSELLTDLQELEDNGISMADETSVNGTLYCIAGDDLGSYCIGGFSENFSSSEYFCRYCLTSRTEFQGEDPSTCGPEHTPDNCRAAVSHLKNEDVSGVQGIKTARRSIPSYTVNKLKTQSYNVASQKQIQGFL